jgi:hypothetical protein
MLLYFIFFIVLCIISFFCYIRLKYRFWALQPVFHFYDLYYWFVSVGIIRTELPEKNRYTNFQDIVTKRVENIDENDWKHVLTLIQLNYFHEKENKYVPNKENIAPYFIGHSSPTYMSYFLETDFLLDNKTGKTIEEKKIIGVITARPLHVKINCSRKDASFDVYYIDYLCVHKSKRKKNIAPQLIQTHEYNQSYNNRKICVSLFKREEELTGIIPLTFYKTYCFPLTKLSMTTNYLTPDVHLLTGDKQNMYYFYNFIQEPSNVNKWSIMVYPEISNIIELVSTNNLLVKMLLTNGNIVCVYIFRKTCLYIEKDKEVLCLIASVCSTQLTKQTFLDGFYAALMSIIKDNLHFGYLSIEDVSDNTSIINEICVDTHPLAISPMAYFFYNFAYSPFKSEKCFIIN